MESTDLIVRSISAFLTTGVSLPREELVRLAGSYVKRCQEAQRRLSDCGRLLAKGQGAEAIYLAEAHPPLLDEVGTLDFAGAGPWTQFCSSSDLPAAEPFDVALVKLLDEQYAQHTNVEPLVNLYRKLAVKKGPITQRISLVRRLAAVDPANPNWRSDLEGLEITRFKEIAATLRQPQSLSEADAMGMLKELTADGMVTRPNPELVSRVRQLHADLKRRRFETTARRLAAQANDAYAAMDLAQLQAGLQSLDQQAVTDGEVIPADVVRSLEDARAWAAEREEILRREAEFESGCHMLERKLEETAPHAEVSRLLLDLQTHGRDLPGDLAERARNEVHSQLVQERRRRSMKVTGIAAAALVLVGAVGAVAWVILDNQERDQIAARIDQFTKAKDFSGGNAFVAQIRGAAPARLNDGLIAKSVVALGDAEKAEAGRQAELSDLTSSIARMASDEPTYNAAVTRAEQIATSVQEKEAIKLLKLEAQAKVARKQKSIDDGLIAKLTEVTKAYEVVAAARDARSIRETAREFDKALKDAELITNASAELRSQVSNYRTRHKSELSRADDLEAADRRAVMARNELRRQIDDAYAKLPDVTAYATLADALQRSNPGDPAIPQHAAWSNLVPYYVAVLKVSDAVEQSKRRVPGAPFTSTSAVFRDITENLASIQTDVPTPWDPTLAAMKGRADGAAKFVSASDDLAKYLRNPLISSLKQFEIQLTGTDKPVRYYARDPTIDESQAGFVSYAFLDSEHRDTKTPAKRRGALVSKPVVAPHCTLATDIEVLLKQERDQPQWHTNMATMFEKCLAPSSANPKVQAALLMKLVELNEAAGGLIRIDDGMKRGITQLDSEEINFLAPSDTPNISTGLADIGERLSRDRATWLAAVRSSTTSPGRLKAEVDAAYRHMKLTGVVMHDGSSLGVKTIGATVVREYWSVQLSGAEPQFVIVATVSADSKFQWIPGRQPPPVGLPLISPADGEDTLSRARQLGLAGSPATKPTASVEQVRGWPINMGELPRR